MDASLVASSGPDTPPERPPSDLSPQAAIGLIERRLDMLVPADPDAPAPLCAAMRDALLAPGKRLRPLLAMASARQLGADPQAALDAGCALEMAHTASLALDDLPCMDDATMRRGRPALHVAHGQDVAILAAIALLSRAFSVVATQKSIDAATRASLAATLADAIGVDGLAGGQLEDLRGAAARHDADDARRCNVRKTGALFVAAVDVGAAVARAGVAPRERLREYAMHLGCAFQIRDDLLDVTATVAETGKDTGRDAPRRTIVGLLGAERAAREMRAHLRAAERAADSVSGAGDGARPLRDFLQAAFGAPRTGVQRTAMPGVGGPGAEPPKAADASVAS